MEIKTILVHVDDAHSADERIGFASRLALAHEAHLVGVTQTGIMRYVYGVAPDDWAGDLTPLFEIARSEAERRAARFETLAAQAGVTSFERRIGDEEPGFALASQAMYADLVVVGQTDPQDPATAHTAIPDYVAVHAPCPVLVLPHTGAFSANFDRVLIAWNASPEAARAVRQALPFLVRASEVEIAAIESEVVSHEAPGGHDLALLLARHGVKVTLRQEQAGGNVADALLARTSAYQADLLVMGCYGHSRFRETVLGGVSRTVLHRMTVPALMAH
jgi:nucleotide-binding universal stress UspA family protein